MLGERAQSGFSAEEMDQVRNIIQEGKRFNFKRMRKDGNIYDDCINGMIELQYKTRIKFEQDVFGFDEFRAIEVENPNTRAIGIKITEINPRYGKIYFRPGARGVATAYCADTKRNREKLADSFFESRRLWDFITLHTKEKEISGTQLQTELRALAKTRQDERDAKKAVKKESIVDRAMSGMTPQEKEKLVNAIVKEENEKRAPIKLEEKAEIDSPVAPAVNSEKSLKEDAKKQVFEEKAELIASLQKKHGKGWTSSKPYREQIKPAIEELVTSWTTEQTENTEAVVI